MRNADARAPLGEIAGLPVGVVTAAARTILDAADTRVQADRLFPWTANDLTVMRHTLAAASLVEEVSRVLVTMPVRDPAHDDRCTPEEGCSCATGPWVAFASRLRALGPGGAEPSSVPVPSPAEPSNDA